MIPVKPQNQIQQNEPEAIKPLPKAKIYCQLAEQFLLPKKSSRCITRDYLVGVYTGNFFRVSLSDINRFKIDITPALLKRMPFIDFSTIIAKLDALLVEQDQPKLGFTKGYMPDTDWLCNIARFIDPCNAACIFEHRVRDQNNAVTDSNKVLIAQKTAERMLLVDNNLLGKRHIMDSLYSLSEARRQLGSKERQLELLKERSIKLSEEIKNCKLIVENKLMATALIFRAEMSQEAELGDAGISEEEEQRRLKKVKET
jgi:hypothetical protein